MLKIKQARKRIKEEKDAAVATPQGERLPLIPYSFNLFLLDPDTSNLPTENAPPPSYSTIIRKEPTPPNRPPPPMPNQAPAMPPRPEDTLFSFGNEPLPPSFDEVYDVSMHVL